MVIPAPSSARYAGDTRIGRGPGNLARHAGDLAQTAESIGPASIWWPEFRVPVAAIAAPSPAAGAARCDRTSAPATRGCPPREPARPVGLRLLPAGRAVPS